MTIPLTERKLKIWVKEGVREALDNELIKLRAMLVPLVSRREQKDIEKRYGQPYRKHVKIYQVKL
jgi:hypothetical protein